MGDRAQDPLLGTTRSRLRSSMSASKDVIEIDRHNLTPDSENDHRDDDILITKKQWWHRNT